MLGKFLMPFVVFVTFGVLSSGYSNAFAASPEKDKKHSEQMHAKFEKRLHEIRAEIERFEMKVKGKMAKMSSTEHKKYNDDVEQFKHREARLSEELSTLKEKSGEELKKMKSELKAAMDDLEHKVKKSTKSISR